MKIVDLEVYYVDLGQSDSFGDDLPAFDWESLVYRIVADDGQDGFSQPIAIHGEGRSIAEYAHHVLRPLILGEDPRFPEKIWQKMVRAMYGFPTRPIGAVDVAIWDLAGRAAGLPIYQMLGAARTSVRAYASTPTLPTPEAYATFSQEQVKQHFTAIKLHAYGDPDKDIAACEAARDAVGPDIDLMLDIVGGYGHDRRAAMRVGRVLERLDFHWYEHPLRENDLDGYVELARRLDIDIAGPDGLLTPEQTRNFVTARGTDLIRPNVEFHGGITGQRKLSHMAELFHVGCEPHTYGFGHMQAANLHTICAMAQPAFLEVPVPLGGLDGISASFRPDDDGMVTVPDGPGVGVSLDMDFVKDSGVRVGV